jgi:hypothetical protein
MKRVILAAILGGIAMFIWTSIAHMFTPLADAGVKELPNESGVMTALQSGLGDNRGLYMFPGFGVGPNPTKEQKNEAMKHMDERLAQNPSGLLMYFPAGRKMSLPRLLGVEFATECIEVLLVSFLLSQTVLAGFGQKWGFFLVAGVLSAIATNVSYWNWYGFPKHYIGSYMLIQVVGFAVAGLVAGALVKTRSS